MANSAAYSDDLRSRVIETLDPASLVFFDDAGSNVEMTPSRGYAPRGKRVVDHAPRSRGGNVSIPSAMTWNGPLGARTFDGAVNGPRFLRWIDKVLAPKRWKGVVVVLDDVRFHKVAGVKEALAKFGARAVYLPPYSPDFNPIERMSSTLKTLLRQAKARTSETLKKAILTSLRRITAMDAAAWMIHDGYWRSVHELPPTATSSRIDQRRSRLGPYALRQPTPIARPPRRGSRLTHAQARPRGRRWLGRRALGEH